MKSPLVTAVLVIWLTAISLVVVWSAVTDAPWEANQSQPVVTESSDRMRESRCAGALRLRESTVEAGIISRSGSGRLPRTDYEQAIRQAQSEIALFC